MLLDGVEHVFEKMGHMGGVGRRRDRHHRPRLHNRAGCRQHRGAAETVADQQRRRLTHFAQVIGGGDEIGDVRRESGVGEFAFARAEAGEVKAQHRDALRRERLRDTRRRHHVLAAGEAMREQRIGARRPFGSVQDGGELLAFGIGEVETLGGHDGSSLRGDAESLAQTRRRVPIN